MQTECPFPVFSWTKWSPDAPSEWRYLFTPGPMKVVAAYYHDGVANEYAKKFGPNGFDFKPGWIVTVEYNADSTSYYNPPLSLLLGKKRIRKQLHEMWLVRA